MKRRGLLLLGCHIKSQQEGLGCNVARADYAEGEPMKTSAGRPKCADSRLIWSSARRRLPDSTSETTDGVPNSGTRSAWVSPFSAIRQHIHAACRRNDDLGVLIGFHEIGERAQVEFFGCGALRLLQQSINNIDGFGEVSIVADRNQRERMDER
jgi:hypothetical protein